MRILRYIAAIIIVNCNLSIVNNACAQKRIVEQPKDTVPLLCGVQVSYNLAGTVMKMASDYGEYEGAVKVSLKNKFFPTFEMGYGMSEHDRDEITTIHAKSSAPYFRLGCDYNIAKNKQDIYRILLGVRYAFSKFDFEVDAEPTDPVWGNKTSYSIKENCNYHWTEVLFGVDAKIWGPLHLGWSIRYKLKLSSKEGSSGDLWYIPGFGKQGNSIGGTFNVGLEL